MDLRAFRGTREELTIETNRPAYGVFPKRTGLVSFRWSRERSLRCGRPEASIGFQLSTYRDQPDSQSGERQYNPNNDPQQG
jgi:hypothetical protein